MRNNNAMRLMYGAYGYNTTTRTGFQPTTWWITIRFVQWVLALIVTIYLTTTSNQEISFRDESPVKSLEGGWGYIVVRAIMSVYLGMMAVFFILYLTKVTIFPILAFIVDIALIFFWVAALVVDIFPFMGYLKEIKKSAANDDGPGYFGLSAHIVAIVSFVLFIGGSIYTSTISYKQFAEDRRKKRSDRYKNASVTAAAAYSGHALETPPASPRPGPNFPSGSGRPLSSASTIAGSDISEPERESKAELERQQEKKQKILALARSRMAPPNYYHATGESSRHSDEEAGIRRPLNDPESGEYDLPTYKA